MRSTINGSGMAGPTQIAPSKRRSWWGRQRMHRGELVSLYRVPSGPHARRGTGRGIQDHAPGRSGQGRAESVGVENNRRENRIPGISWAPGGRAGWLRLPTYYLPGVRTPPGDDGREIKKGKGEAERVRRTHSWVPRSWTDSVAVSQCRRTSLTGEALQGSQTLARSAVLALSQEAG